MNTLSIITWNINGLKSSIKNKSIETLIENELPDIICLQEIKIKNENDIFALNHLFDKHSYTYYINYDSIKKGYAGVMIIYRNTHKNLKSLKSVKKVLNCGRILCLEFESLNIITVYTPNSGRKLTNLQYRLKWDQMFEEYIKNYIKEYPNTIICGDLNLFYSELDIHPHLLQSRRKSLGQSQQSLKELKSWEIL